MTETSLTIELDAKEKGLHILIAAPREPAPRSFTFKAKTTVGEAAREAADAFGYTGGNPTLQNRAGHLLERGETLHDEHVKDGDELELVDVGGGV